jgi:Arc/MetJ-type ribon-helix-helix transcriptional regulator
MSNKYVTVKLPQEIIVDIDLLVGTHGYSSRTEVCKDAIRRLMKELKEAA